jgi:hypothetical protein
MSEDIKFGLTDLDVSDDLDVALDNDTYQDQANPAPVAAGDYMFRLSAGSIRPALYRGGEKKGQPLFRTVNGQSYPILSLGVVEIVDGLGDGVTRKVGLFQDIHTFNYERDGKNVSQIGDLARSIGLGNYQGINEALLLLEEAQQSGATFAAQLDWESGFDKEFVEAATEQLGLKGIDRADLTDEQRKLANAIQYRYSKVQGMKLFPYNPATGRFSPTLVRGNVAMKVGEKNLVIEVPTRTLEARAIIPVYFNDMKFISRERVDSGRVTFGPKSQKPVAVAA